mmetsp:Transcript_2420/g.8895  ORF Transcript_2420/g.8895 Transcript_2420/m.8895 type:complete len:324 (-) Transcript_2420:2741-3712(-)
MTAMTAVVPETVTSTAQRPSAWSTWIKALLIASPASRLDAPITLESDSSASTSRMLATVAAARPCGPCPSKMPAKKVSGTPWSFSWSVATSCPSFFHPCRSRPGTATAAASTKPCMADTVERTSSPPCSCASLPKRPRRRMLLSGADLRDEPPEPHCTRSAPPTPLAASAAAAPGDTLSESSEESVCPIASETADADDTTPVRLWRLRESLLGCSSRDLRTEGQMAELISSELRAFAAGWSGDSDSSGESSALVGATSDRRRTRVLTADGAAGVFQGSYSSCTAPGDRYSDGLSFERLLRRWFAALAWRVLSASATLFTAPPW